MIGLLLVIFAQTAPPCPPNMSLLECQLCQELYLSQDIPYDECPCWDETYSPIASAGEGTGVLGYCCTPLGCVEILVCYEECLELHDDAVFLGDTSCVDAECVTYEDTGCCINMECQIVNASECIILGGTLNFDLCASACPVGSISTEGACCWIGLDLVMHCDMRDQGDCEGDLNYISWENGGDCDTPCDPFPDDLCPDVTDVGACCIDNACYEDVPAVVCASVGTEYAQYGDCDDLLEPCEDDPAVSGACCIGSSTCVYVSELACNTVGGAFYSNTQCNEISCGDDPPDPPDGELEMSCCWEDDTCTDDVLVTVCILANGSPKYGTCATIDCSQPGNDKTCICILLDRLIGINTSILAELIDQGVSLDVANEWLQSISASSSSIEQHTANLLILTSLIQTDIDNIDTNVQTLIDELTDSPNNGGYTGSGINDAVHLSNIQGSGNQVNEEMGEAMNPNMEFEFSDTDSLGTAPVVTIDIPAVTIGGYTADLDVMEWDLQMLHDWGVVQLLRVIIIFAFSWWGVKHLYEELRRYG